jgi:hypothetical protein
MSHIHGWKTMSAWRKHRAEVLRANRHGSNIVHVEGLGSMSESNDFSEMIDSGCYEYKVIGNIHENPELLEAR